MKTLKLSSLAAVIACLSLFTACTKDLDSPTPQASYDLNETSATKKGGSDEGAETFTVSNGSKNSKAMATVANFQLKSNPARVGNTIHLTANVAFSEAVYKAQVQIQKSVKDANGNWSDWAPVTDYNGKIELKEKTDAPVRSYTVDYSFIATEAGESRWLLHIGGGDVINTFCDYQTLTVIDCVEALTIKPSVVGKDLENGNYEFTVTYQLTSPVDMDNITFQGGATSGGKFQHNMGGLVGLEVLHNNNQNTVLIYTGSLKACTPLELSFTYTRKFSCPAVDATVTGDWKLESNNIEVAKVAPLLYACN